MPPPMTWQPQGQLPTVEAEPGWPITLSVGHLLPGKGSQELCSQNQIWGRRLGPCGESQDYLGFGVAVSSQFAQSLAPTLKRQAGSLGPSRLSSASQDVGAW